MTGSTTEISIVVPVYNSEGTLEELVQSLIGAFQGRLQFEIILVNDGSRDNSHQVCKNLSLRHPFVKYLCFYKNFGQINALMAGLNEATGRVAVIMDDDLQNPPSEVIKLYNAIHEGRDFAYGVPEKTLSDGYRAWGTKLNFWMAKVLLGKPEHIFPTSFLAMTDDLVKNIIQYRGPYPYLAGLIFRITTNGVNVTVAHSPRKKGTSTYTFGKLLKLWLNGFTNFSVLPLRVASLLGFVVSICGFCLLIFLGLSKLFFSDYLSGWVSIIGGILLFSGLQLIALGLLGEYLGRVFMVLNQAPQFAVRERYNCSTDSDAVIRK